MSLALLIAVYRAVDEHARKRCKVRKGVNGVSLEGHIEICTARSFVRGTTIASGTE
jgi:hypothetical protein